MAGKKFASGYDHLQSTKDGHKNYSRTNDFRTVEIDEEYGQIENSARKQ